MILSRVFLFLVIYCVLMVLDLLALTQLQQLLLRVSSVLTQLCDVIITTGASYGVSCQFDSLLFENHFGASANRLL